MTRNVDVAVLGAGNAGLAAARAARHAGMSVLVAESRALGGTCPLRGCVPKKVLVAAAEAMDTIARSGAHRIAIGKPRLDWAALIARKESFVEGVPGEIGKRLAKDGVDVVEHAARFTGRNLVAVNGTQFRARKTVIATGSKPRMLSVPGFEHAIDSDAILERTERPASLVFIGAGVIAMEFAHVFARAGTRVTLVEIAERPLSEFDADAVDRLVEETRALGIEILLGAKTERIVAANGGYDVHVEVQGKTRTLSAEIVANGAGRIPDVADLDLDAGGIRHDDLRIAVDRFLRSESNADVFVAGDTASGPQLSPVATYEGRIVGHNLTGGELKSPDYRCIPACVFSVPTLAGVGLTEAAARDQGLNFDARAHDMSGWRSARTQAERAAYAKVLVERPGGAILGAHVLGHQAGEIIHLFAFAMKHGLGADALRETVYAYPTMASDIQHML